MVGDDFLDFGELVEPGDEGRAQFAVFKALVELFADEFGEAGDFAGASHLGRSGGRRKTQITKYKTQEEGAGWKEIAEG